MPCKQFFPQAIPWRTQNLDQCSIGKEKQKDESTRSLQLVSVSTNLISIAPNQIESVLSYLQ